jgi:hypothetical protein
MAHGMRNSSLDFQRRKNSKNRPEIVEIILTRGIGVGMSRAAEWLAVSSFPSGKTLKRSRF